MDDDIPFELVVPEEPMPEEPIDKQSEKVMKGLTNDGLRHVIRNYHRRIVDAEARAFRNKFFNGLSHAQLERLIFAFEETTEIQQAVCKALRFGLEEHHPDTPDVSNRKLIGQEIGDLMGVVKVLAASGDIRLDDISAARAAKVARLAQWAKHQKGIDDDTDKVTK